MQRYNAEQIGNVLAWTGLPQLLLIPLVPMMMKRFDARYIGFLGISIFAISCFMNVMLSADNAGDQFWIPNIIRAIGQALVLTPITAITTGASLLPTPLRPPASRTCSATSAAQSARQRSGPF